MPDQTRRVNSTGTAAIRALISQDGYVEDRLLFWCPGCNGLHAMNISGDRPPRWQFDGNLEAPTCTPSLLCSPNHKPSRCHHHALAGQKVPLPPLPDWLTEDGAHDAEHK